MRSTSDSPMVTRTRSGDTMVRPQPVTEQSLMESVAGFINEVQALHQPAQDPKCQVTWARFEQTDINDPSLYADQGEGGTSVPLLLVLGYGNGVQIWLIPASGEAKLVMSRFHGQVKCLRLLPSPECSQFLVDHFASSRPVIALCDSSCAGAAFMSVSFVSLRSGEQIQNIKFGAEVADICVNKRVVCIAFRERVAVFDARTLREKVNIVSCYPSPGVHSNPLALHDRWLAYADKSLYVSRKSAGGMEGGVNQSVTAWGINVGSKLASGMTKICSNIFSGSPRNSAAMTVAQGVNPGDAQHDGETGVVTILDVVDMCSSDTETETLDIVNTKMEGVVAHFVAHNKAIVALQWDPSGSLLLSADKPGHNFHLFRIVAHPLGSAFAAVHHLYTLYRGDTPGSVQDVAFAPDSRWVAVSTLRGTTHIFPICPYGGPVGVRTHTSSRVVNKLSRFHRSAGLNETPASSSSGRNSPNPTLGSTPVSDKVFDLPPGMYLGSPIAYPSPHLPPYPSPTLVQPTAQLRQPYIVSITSQVNLTGARKTSLGPSKRTSVPDDIPIRLAVTFAPPRARVMQAGVHGGYSRHSKKPADSLYVMANHGQLLEYSLEPVPDPTIPKDKVCESSPIELNIVAYGQWNLGKPAGRDRVELVPPLESTNPLLISKEMLGSQENCWNDDENEDRWLSQVEIVTHIGPARRLWMGPQFLFRTFQKFGQQEDDLNDLDVTVTTRQQHSEPMQMPGRNQFHGGSKPVFIECGSANSFELSPRFANMSIRGSRETVHMDVENELREAMSDTIKEEGGDRRQVVRSLAHAHEEDEEFFCLSTEDVRSTPAITEGARTRNSSGQSRSRHTSLTSRPVEMMIAETKIFSVAVQHGKSESSSNREIKLQNVDSQMIDRPVILNSSQSSHKRQDQDNSFPELNSDDEFKPAQREIEVKTEDIVEVDKVIVVPEEKCKEDLKKDTEVVPETSKKSKKSKKKNKNNSDTVTCSSADESKEVEVKQKKKKNKKEKSPEPEPKEELIEIEAPTIDDVVDGKTDDANEIFEEFVKEEVSYPEDFSPEKDLVEFSEEEKVVEIEDDDSVQFFIREKSSSVESEDLQVSIDPEAAKPNPWFNKFLNKSSSLIEDQIFGAAKKYGDIEDDKNNDDDEDMLELEANKASVETNIAALLEDEEVMDTNSARMSSSLPMILKVESHPKHESVSSDDDMQFKPVPNKRNKKKQKQKSIESEFDTQDSCPADSESEKVSEFEDSRSTKSKSKSSKDGWSFEIDEEDVNKLLESDNIRAASEETEERTALEDVFRFDSEMVEEEDTVEKNEARGTVDAKSVSVEDLNDALLDETDDSEAEGGITIRKRRDTVDTDNEEFKECRGGVTLSSSCPDTTDASESSVTNSPNPRQTKSKGKKGKKKKR